MRRRRKKAALSYEFHHDTVDAIFDPETLQIHVKPRRTGKPFSLQFEFHGEATEIMAKLHGAIRGRMIYPLSYLEKIKAVSTRHPDTYYKDVLYDKTEA